jgi:hypothetical protein
MNIYLLDDPMLPSIHPMFAHVGTWSDGSVCKTCGKTSETLIEPLLVEWMAGSREIGDFSWCGYTPVVLDHVKTWLVQSKFEVRFGKVKVVQPSLSKYQMPRVAFPYVGPRLHWMMAEKKLRLDERASGIEPKQDCLICGQKQTEFVREGIFIPKANWKGEKIFEIYQNGKSGAMLTTEAALEMMNKQGFTNYVTSPAGRIG